MSEYIHLIGAEDVRRASANMESAAQTMSAAAAQIEESLRNHQRFMDEWLERFEQALAEKL